MDAWEKGEQKVMLTKKRCVRYRERRWMWYIQVTQGKILNWV